jgi:hypothetical protein
MAAPVIQTTIYFPALAQWRDVSACVDMGTTLEVTEAIEAPAETNSYVAPDIQMKLYEGTSDEFLLSWFDTIQPDDLNWTVEIKLEGIPIFTGFVLPTSLQIDNRERWAGFTAIGKAGLLARTSADTDLFKRPTSSGWLVSSAQGNAWRAEIVITKSPAQVTCEYVTDDILGIDMGGGSIMEVKVITVSSTFPSPPYPVFTLSVEGMEAPPLGGAAITLLSPYYRNVTLQNAVNTLFAAAGLAAPLPANFNVIPIANASSPFATRPTVTGLVGYPQSVTPSVFEFEKYYPVIGTTSGTYIQYNPPLGVWVAAPNYLQNYSVELVDWTDDNNFTTMGYWISGPRTEQTPSGSDYDYVFWHYWLTTGTPAPPGYRFGVMVRVSQEPDSSGYYSATTTLYREATYDGYTWARTHTQTVASGAIATLVNLHNEIGETIGIYSTGLRSSAGKLVFTHPDGTSATGYTTAYVSLADLSGYTAIGTMRGKVRRNGVFSIDTQRDATPTAHIWDLTEFGVPIFTQAMPLPVGFQPKTLTYNPGDGYWYALAVSEARGVELLSYTSSGLDQRTGYIPTQIEASGTTYSSFDLTCIRTPSPPAGAWPMVALVGGNVWWIAYSFTGLIPYFDTEGLSCADVLAQLGVTVDAFFLVDAGLDTHFRSRAAFSARTIDTGVNTGSTRIDDDGCFMLRRAAIWYKTVKHVTVENETDDAITGSAGLAAFAGTEQALSNASRFITTTSFAQALAQNTLGYLGRKLSLLDVEHELDGRRYEVGRTFTAIVNSVLTTYQIVNAVIRPATGTVHVQGLEM